MNVYKVECSTSWNKMFTQQPAHFRDDRGRLDREIMVSYLGRVTLVRVVKCLPHKTIDLWWNLFGLYQNEAIVR